MRRIVAIALHSAALWAGLIAARPLAAEALPEPSLTKEVLAEGIYEAMTAMACPNC